jgi:hypothetical protein
VAGGHVLDDREAQAGASGVARAGSVHPVEPLEDPDPLGLGDAGALVGDADLRHRARSLPDEVAGHDDAGALRAVPHRVVDQVAQGRDQLA